METAVEWAAVPHVCACLIFVVMTAAGASTLLMYRTYGRSPWAAAIFPLGGLLLVAECYVSLEAALFSTGLMTTLLSHNIVQAWSARLLGPELHRVQMAKLLVRGGAASFVLVQIFA